MTKILVVSTTLNHQFFCFIEFLRFPNRVCEKMFSFQIGLIAVKSLKVEKEFSIELPEGAVCRLCGANDKNIKIIEESLGISIYSRGNFLSVEDERTEMRERFKFVIERILDEIADGRDCSADLIRSILLSPKNSAVFQASAYSILIPISNKRIYPRTKGQAELVSLMRKFDLVFAEGPAGSGKTFIAVAEALSLLLSHKVNSIILTRPVVEAGENLGFLPGSLEEKINPYLRPLFDSISDCLPKESAKKLAENNLVEIAPLAYMRGRTLKNCAVILDEAQNTTAEQMKMILTRLGENSKMFVTGDKTQIDLPKKKTSGFVHALEVLKNTEGIGFAHLTEEDCVRSELVKKIIRAYEIDAEKNLEETEKDKKLEERFFRPKNPILMS